jgi:hypothetical protein
LTFDWFRILNEPPKKGHTREQKISPIWEEVRNEFNTYFPGGENNRPITRLSSNMKDLKCTSDDLVKQAVGCLATAVSRTRGVAMDGASILSYVADRIKEHGDDLLKKAMERSEKFSVENGYGNSPAAGAVSYDPRSAMDPSCLDAKRGVT